MYDGKEEGRQENWAFCQRTVLGCCVLGCCVLRVAYCVLRVALLCYKIVTDTQERAPAFGDSKTLYRSASSHKDLLPPRLPHLSNTTPVYLVQHAIHYHP
jgi:hypothetical protein